MTWIFDISVELWVSSAAPKPDLVPMKPLHPRAIWALLPFTFLLGSCELIGLEKESNLKLTYDQLANKYIEFVPTDEQTGQIVNKWQYGFYPNGEIIGCNANQAYSVTGYSPEDNTITVYFPGGVWVKYTFTDHKGSVENNTMTAKFKGQYGPPYESERSAGTVSMVSGFTLGGCPND